MKKMNASFLVNTLPILATLIVFAIVFDWRHSIGIFFRERKIDQQKAFINDIVYDVKIDTVEAAESNGRVNDEYILVNTLTGSAFHIRYTYDESKKKTNLEEYKNYDIRRCSIGNDLIDKVKTIVSSNSSTLNNSTTSSKSVGDYSVYQNDRLKKVVSKTDTESVKTIDEIKNLCKPITNL